MRIAVHVTHEAAVKIGGIGAVLNGVCTAPSYKAFFDHTVFYGPLFDFGSPTMSLFGPEGKVLYSTPDYYAAEGHDAAAGALEELARKHRIEIVHGRRKLVSEFDPSLENVVDVLLIGIHKMPPAEVGKFKYELWKRFGLESDRFEGNWDYEQYLRIAIPFLELLEGCYGAEAEYCHFSHEYMGMPSALAALAAGGRHKTIFVAHEVSTARHLVEEHPGHDLTFYNLLEQFQGKQSLEQVFGNRGDNARHELIKLAVHLDRIFAVSDVVKEEYFFLRPDAPREKVRTVYNGVSAPAISLGDKAQSRSRIEAYLLRLLGYTPAIILTHVSRMVVSKGLWRDISLLYHLDEILAARHLTGAYILLSTLIGTGRPQQDILRLEAEYGWPVAHRAGWPDLVGMEQEIYTWLEIFNARSRAIKALYINQFGFDQVRCGSRVPEGADLADLRIASDAELGFSIYEPYGIAQVETVPFGGVALLSYNCGSARFIEQVFAEAPVKPFYAVDFVAAAKGMSPEALRNLSREQRDRLEQQTIAEHAPRIFAALPLTEAQRGACLAVGQQYGAKMSWECIVRDWLLPNLST